MPSFRFHLRRRDTVEPDEWGLIFPDLHRAYLAACATMPDVARDELIAGRDPMVCAFLICDGAGRQLLEVPFGEILSPAEWRPRRARPRRHGGPRSREARDRLALRGFRTMFSTVNVGCVLLTPDLHVIEMNDYGARHSHVDVDAIRDTSILDIFALAGQAQRDFADYFQLARAGATSELIDMPYLMLDEQGATIDGWWKARAWPIHDDDGRIIGIAEWAEPFATPLNGGRTRIRAVPGLPD